MSKPKIALVYYSTYGTNYAVALEAKAAMEAAGAEVRLRRVAETAPPSVVEGQPAWKEQADRSADIAVATPDDMEWADGYWISCPTRYGVPASQMRAFIDTLGPLWGKGGLANKTFSCTSSAQNAHGGMEATVLSLNTTAMHWGCLLVPPGYTDPVTFAAGGCPYGTVVKAGEFDDAHKAAVRFQATRLVEYTQKLVG